MWSLAGRQGFDQLICCFGPESCAASRSNCFGPELHRLVGLLLWALCGAASLCSRFAPTRGFRCGRPAGVSGVGGQSANLGVCNWASGV